MTEPTRTEIDFASNEHRTPGLMFKPPSPRAGLVVIQEWWGLVPHIEDVSIRLAQEGYLTLTPDLYYGKQAEEPDEARKLAMAMDRDRALREIVAAAAYLKSEGLEKIGVIGWCMGGGLALSAAAEDGLFTTAVCFYGKPLSENDIQRLHVPILALYAGHDHGITPDEVELFDQSLDELGIPHEIHMYVEADHAFFNDSRPSSYNAQASEDAWKKALDWFSQYLG